MKLSTKISTLACTGVLSISMAVSALASENEPNRAEIGNSIISIETEQELPPFMPIPSLAADGELAPKGSLRSVFTNAEEDVKVSIFGAEESSLQLTDYPVNEFWVLLEGKVSFTGESGDTQVFSAGDYLIIPKGYTGSSQIIEKIKKLSISF